MRLLRAFYIGGFAPKPPGFNAFFRQNGPFLALVKGNRFHLSPAFPAAEPVARVASQHCPIPSDSGRLIINHAIRPLNRNAANGEYPLNFVSHVWGSPQYWESSPCTQSIISVKTDRKALMAAEHSRIMTWKCDSSISSPAMTSASRACHAASAAVGQQCLHPKFSPGRLKPVRLASMTLSRTKVAYLL